MPSVGILFNADFDIVMVAWADTHAFAYIIIYERERARRFKKCCFYDFTIHSFPIVRMTKKFELVTAPGVSLSLSSSRLTSHVIAFDSHTNIHMQTHTAQTGARRSTLLWHRNARHRGTLISSSFHYVFQHTV